jgi:hypothetical protein
MLAVAVSAFLTAFGGSWTCTAPAAHGVAGSVTQWTIAAAPRGPWTRIVVGPAGSGEVAYVGYLRHDRAWIYESFHDDGSFSTSVSPGPAGGVWTWHGTFTTPDGARHDSVQWRREGDTLHRRFGRSMGRLFFTSASDVCRR